MRELDASKREAGGHMTRLDTLRDSPIVRARVRLLVALVVMPVLGTLGIVGLAALLNAVLR